MDLGTILNLSDEIAIFIGGLLTGWNLLSQPEWVKALLDRIRRKIAGEQSPPE